MSQSLYKEIIYEGPNDVPKVIKGLKPFTNKTVIKKP